MSDEGVPELNEVEYADLMDELSAIISGESMSEIADPDEWWLGYTTALNDWRNANIEPGDLTYALDQSAMEVKRRLAGRGVGVSDPATIQAIAAGATFAMQLLWKIAPQLGDDITLTSARLGLALVHFRALAG